MEYFSEGTGIILWIMMLSASGLLVILGFRFSRQKAYTGQTIIPVAMILFSLVLWAITFSFPTEEAGPSLIPHLWIFWLVLLSISVLLLCATGKTEVDPKSGRLGFLAQGVLLVVAYYHAIGLLGYFISSFIFLAVAMYMLSCRKVLTVALVCSGWVLFSYLVFYKLLYINLPLGFFENFI